MKKGFTLIELMIILAIISILFSLLFRACGKRRVADPSDKFVVNSSQYKSEKSVRETAPVQEEAKAPEYSEYYSHIYGRLECETCSVDPCGVALSSCKDGNVYTCLTDVRTK